MRKYILSNAVLILCLSVLLHVFLESISTPPPPEFARHIPPRWDILCAGYGDDDICRRVGCGHSYQSALASGGRAFDRAERQKTEAELKNLEEPAEPSFSAQYIK